MSTPAFCRTDGRPAALTSDAPATRQDMLWVTWVGHRRSTELARALDVPLHEILSRASRPVRYLAGGILTIAMLVRTRPRVIFVQNPSLVLAALACALKRFLGFAVVVDRHSNFTFADTESGPLNALSNYTLRRADLTIVTNKYVKELAESKGGRAFVLPDKLPALNKGTRVQLAGRINVAFVCSYSADEPVIEVIEAARQLPEDVKVYITGNAKRLPQAVRREAPPNVVFTGFLSAADYESLMASVDLVLELTTRDHTLLCGAYEAVSLGKPLVISRTDALVQYFRRGVVITENHPTAIANAVREALGRLDSLRHEVAELRDDLEREWSDMFAEFGARIERL